MARSTTPRRKSGKLRNIALLLILAAGGAATWLYFNPPEANADKPAWRTVKVVRGSVASTVSASGSLKAVVTVEVGSQISGQIKAIYVDFNGTVKKGQPIALIDPDSFEAKVAEARADLAVARANVEMQAARGKTVRAESRAARAAFVAAQADFSRKKALLPARAISQSQYDQAVSALDQARAKWESAQAKEAEQKAQLAVAVAQVAQKRAQLAQRRLDLERTVIRSPVDGVIINRNIDVGQTVAASLQAPVLFTIAKDLREMQVEVSVDEADIGRIQQGQAVEFGVDSFPGRTFTGAVKQIRLQPTEVSNVITYTVIVSTRNSDMRLLPGMTANVTFNVSRKTDVLLVPNRALRYRPPGARTGARTGAGPRGAQGRGGGRGRSARLVRRLTKALNLDRDQQAQLRDIFAAMGRKVREMRAKGAPRSEMAAQFRKMRAQMPGKIMNILTAEQRKKYLALSRRRAVNPVRRARLHVVGPGGEAKAIRVWIGITDGRVSEIRRGPLKAGDKVITGMAPRKKRSRLRLGF